MSTGDGAFQYVPLDKLKIYQNNTLFNTLLRRLNFSNKFSLLEVPGTDSVDIDIGTEIQGLGELTDVAITNPILRQAMLYDGTKWLNDFITLNDIANVQLTNPIQVGMSLRYDGSKYVNAFPFIDDLVDAVVSNPQAQQVLRHNGISWLNAFLSSSDLSDVAITAAATGQVLRYDGTNWVNVAASAINLLLNDLTDVIITAAATGQFLGFNGSNWVNTLIALDALSDVVIGTLQTGQTLLYNGTNWVNLLLTLDLLTDVAITTPTNGQVLKYNGTTWINAAPAAGVVNIDDLGDVTAPTPAPGDVLKYTGSTWANAGLAETLTLNQISDVSISSPVGGHVLTYSGGAWINQMPVSGGGGATQLNELTDVTITSAAVGDILRHNGTEWVDVPIAELVSLTQLSDVAITTPATAQVTRYNGTSWVNSLLSIDDLSDAVITTPTTGQILTHNGTNWVNTTPAAGGGAFNVLPDTGSNWGIWNGGAHFGTGLFAGCFTEGTISSRQDTTTTGKACTEFITGAVNDNQAGFSGVYTAGVAGSGIGAPAAGFYIRRDQDPYLKIKFQLPDIATIRFTIGFEAVGDLPVNSDDILGTGVAGFIFYFSSTVTTNLEVRRNDASGAAVVVDTGTAVAVNTPLTLEIITENANSRMGWRVNGGTTTFYTTDIPAATTSMNYFIKTETKTDGTKPFTQYYCYITQNPS